MRTLLDPLSFLVVSLSGWLNQHQQQVIHYLIEENRVLREQIGNRRMRFSDDQRRRLAVRAKANQSETPPGIIRDFLINSPLILNTLIIRRHPLTFISVTADSPNKRHLFRVPWRTPPFDSERSSLE
jgi:hypothetical protein